MTIELAAEVLAAHLPILAFTGAGVSTESGVPDFRGPNGLWTKMDPADFTIERYLSDPERRQRGWKLHAEGQLWGARAPLQPNRAHLALADLFLARKLSGCVTQNVDGLHLKSGLPEEVVAEIHGHVRTVRCLDCKATWPTETVLVRVDQGEAEPRCEECGGIIKTTTVMFGEHLFPETMEKAWELADQSNAVLAIGTTLGVWPAAEIPWAMVQAEKPLVIINQGETEMDRLASVRLDGGAGETMAELAARLIP
ncbi:MAG: Sir2 family NAD-dependent protein deacetylase [Actinobacteria bacterium]|nr:Sir2 family NAD-dependent protein deacetylase [Actinomycetota bacterium]